MPVLHVPHPAPDLSGSHIGLLGFPDGLAAELSETLRRAECLASNLREPLGDGSAWPHGFAVVVLLLP